MSFGRNTHRSTPNRRLDLLATTELDDGPRRQVLVRAQHIRRCGAGSAGFERRFALKLLGLEADAATEVLRRIAGRANERAMRTIAPISNNLFVGRKGKVARARD